MIDWDRVRELRSEIGAEDFDEVVALFLEEADEAITRLTPGGDARSLAANLHFLKGAALNLGFRQLSTLCQEGERRANLGDTDVDLVMVCTTYAQSRRVFQDGAAAAFAA